MPILSYNTKTLQPNLLGVVDMGRNRSSESTITAGGDTGGVGGGNSVLSSSYSKSLNMDVDGIVVLPSSSSSSSEAEADATSSGNTVSKRFASILRLGGNAVAPSSPPRGSSISSSRNAQAAASSPMREEEDEEDFWILQRCDAFDEDDDFDQHISGDGMIMGGLNHFDIDSHWKR